jgi:hypothetical protein
MNEKKWGSSTFEKKQFLVRALPKKENFLQNITEEEKEVMAQHFAYVNKMAEEGKFFSVGLV